MGSNTNMLFLNYKLTKKLKIFVLLVKLFYKLEQ